MGTPLANKARGTLSGRNANVDDLMAMPILPRQPLDALTPLRAPGMPCLPVKGEVSGSEAGVGPSLPARVRSHWPDQIDLVLALTVHQVFGGDIAHIKQLLPREDLTLSQRRLDRRRPIEIR
jgi:hypothetical protein